MCICAHETWLYYYNVVKKTFGTIIINFWYYNNPVTILCNVVIIMYCGGTFYNVIYALVIV